MPTRYRALILGLLGLGFITFPFLWLGLKYNYATGAITTVWNGANGIKFFSNLLIAFGFVAILVVTHYTNKYWDWMRPVKHTLHPVVEIMEQPWWKPVAMLIVLSAVFFLSDKSLDLGVQLGIYILLALGLNITVGFTGLLVLGYAAFFSFGAYIFAVCQQLIPGLQWWIAFPFVFVIGGLLGWLLGLPCLRLRGDYLAIVTLGFAESFKELLSNLKITNGDKGITLSPASMLQPIPGLTQIQTAYIVVAVFLFASLFFIRRLYNSPIGRAWVAIREDEIAANSMGIDVVKLKLLAFALSAGVGALSGLLYILYASFIDPSSAAFDKSAMVLAMVVLGGIGSIYGVMLGAALLYLIPEFLRDSQTIQSLSPHFSDYRLLIFGAIMVAMMLLRPQGLLGSHRHRHEIKRDT
jgi:branched-chain amino acid transport system permease protein